MTRTSYLEQGCFYIICLASGNTTDTRHGELKHKDEVTWEIGEGSSLYNVLPVQSLQDLGAAEPLEATLHVVVIPFKGLYPQNPADKTTAERKHDINSKKNNRWQINWQESDLIRIRIPEGFLTFKPSKLPDFNY